MEAHNRSTKKHAFAFILWIMVALILQLMAFGASPYALPAPDLMIIVCFLFRFRLGARIGFIPVFIALLLSDLISDQLPGLRTLTYFILLEFISLRHREFKSVGFIGEWFTFFIFLCISFFVFWIIALDSRQTFDAVKLFLITLLFYPVLRYTLRLLVFKP